jgi:hypothetical protein
LPVVILLLKVKGVLLAPQSPIPKDVIGLRQFSFTPNRVRSRHRRDIWA